MNQKYVPKYWRVWNNDLDGHSKNSYTCVLDPCITHYWKYVYVANESMYLLRRLIEVYYTVCLTIIWDDDYLPQTDKLHLHQLFPVTALYLVNF